MRVIIECETEVTDVMHRVFCLHHGAESHHLNDIRLISALYLIHKGVQTPCHCALRTSGFHLVSKLGDEVFERFELLWVWFIMHTVRQCLCYLALCHLSYALCHGPVRKEHELLNELVGILRALEIAAYRLSCLVDFKAHFLTIELDSAILESLCAEFLSETIEGDECFSILPLIVFLLWSRLARAIHHAILLQ